MRTTSRTQIERRADSDSRIIKAAIKCFGECGYTNCTFTNIARNADVTPGLITQRFQTKENLYSVAFKTVILKTYATSDVPLEVPASLFRVVEESRILFDTYIEGFNFLRVSFNASDLPDSYKVFAEELFMSRQYYAPIRKAQLDGIIPEGNIYSLFLLFLSNVFNNIYMCSEFNIPFPDPDAFIGCFKIPDAVLEERRKQREALIRGMSDSFRFLSYIDVDANSASLIVDNMFGVNFEQTFDVRTTLREAFENGVVPEHQEMFGRFLDLDSLDERIGDKYRIVCYVKNINGEIHKNVIIPINREPNGHIRTVLAGVLKDELDEQSIRLNDID